MWLDEIGRMGFNYGFSFGVCYLGVKVIGLINKLRVLEN